MPNPEKRTPRNLVSIQLERSSRRGDALSDESETDVGRQTSRGRRLLLSHSNWTIETPDPTTLSVLNALTKTAWQEDFGEPTILSSIWGLWPLIKSVLDQTATIIRDIPTAQAEWLAEDAKRERTELDQVMAELHKSTGSEEELEPIKRRGRKIRAQLRLKGLYLGELAKLLEKIKRKAPLDGDDFVTMMVVGKFIQGARAQSARNGR
jgi:hypothetical protein